MDPLNRERTVKHIRDCCDDPGCPNRQIANHKLGVISRLGPLVEVATAQGVRNLHSACFRRLGGRV